MTTYVASYVLALLEATLERVTTIRCDDVGCDDCHATWLVRKRPYLHFAGPSNWTLHDPSCPYLLGVVT